MLNGESGFDPKKKVIEELIKYLSSKDDEDLGGVMKPKGAGIEMASVEGKDDDADDMGDSGAPQAEGISDGDGDESNGSGIAGMSEEDLNDLIEAMSGKVG